MRTKPNALASTMSIRTQTATEILAAILGNKDLARAIYEVANIDKISPAVVAAIAVQQADALIVVLNDGQEDTGGANDA